MQLAKTLVGGKIRSLSTSSDCNIPPLGGHSITQVIRDFDWMQTLGHCKGLAIGSLNINSLLLHIDELKCFSKKNGFHILALNEIELDNTIADNLLEMEGFTLC